MSKKLFRLKIFLEHNWLAISSFLFLELRRKQHYFSDYSKIMLLFTVTIKYTQTLRSELY